MGVAPPPGPHCAPPAVPGCAAAEPGFPVAKWPRGAPVTEPGCAPPSALSGAPPAEPGCPPAVEPGCGPAERPGWAPNAERRCAPAPAVGNVPAAKPGCAPAGELGCVRPTTSGRGAGTAWSFPGPGRRRPTGMDRPVAPGSGEATEPTPSVASGALPARGSWPEAKGPRRMTSGGRRVVEAPPSSGNAPVPRDTGCPRGIVLLAPRAGRDDQRATEPAPPPGPGWERAHDVPALAIQPGCSSAMAPMPAGPRDRGAAGASS